jgi:uncharacterized repeat protein (TIGR03803 family)
LAHAATQKVLYTFTGGADGAQPYAGVIFDKAGNLYGVTQAGGLYGQGAVFELSPSPDGTWTETVLYNFTGHTDGALPIGALRIDDAGNLYGSAANGGDPSAQCGTLFELSPSEGGWTFTVTHTFLGYPDDGCHPTNNWTTIAGGSNNDGAAWGYRGMYSFGGSGGSQPWGNGIAYTGGAHGYGTVYDLQFRCPAVPAQGKCYKRVIARHAFSGGKNGSNPMGDTLDLNVGGSYVTYGTTTKGGGSGTVYQLAQNAKGGWTFHVIYRFSGTDGAYPSAGLITDSAGNLYGTTTWGGTNDAGTVFKLTPSLNKYNKVVWSLTTLCSFTGGDDGSDIYSGVIFDSAGNLFGTAVKGGTYGQGVVYQILP